MSPHLFSSSIAKRFRGSVRNSSAPVEPHPNGHRFSEFVEVSDEDWCSLLDDIDPCSGARPSMRTNTRPETWVNAPSSTTSFLSRVGASISRRKTSLKSRLFSSHPKGSSQDEDINLGHFTLEFPLPPTYIPNPSAQFYKDDDTKNKDQQCQRNAPFYAQSNTSSPSRIKSAFRVTYHGPSNKAAPRGPQLARSETFTLPPRPHARPKLALEPLTELNLFSGESPLTALHPPILFGTSFEGASETNIGLDRPDQYQQNFLTIDPQEFTPSPLAFQTTQLPLAASSRTSFAPPSPSWLSRNIWEIQDEEDEPDVPDSPLPLPIPPPRFRERYSYSDEESALSSGPIDNETLVGSTDNSPLSTLYFKLTPATPNPGQSPSASVRSLPALDSPNPHDLTQPARLSRSISLTDLHHEKPAQPSTAVFPPPELQLFAPDFFDLSPGVSGALSSLCTQFGIALHLTSTSPERSMDYFGKRNDVVDFGGEADYENVQWFKDPPPPRTPAPPPLAQTPATNQPSNYRPSPDVILQNEAFDYALKAAPSILYQRNKEFGQLGVLAWCAEFAELIDNIKVLGYNGQMFVETRTQALKTCEDLLKLKLDIKMQIIVMFLVHQVTRMRRFLDGNRQWDDYPEIEFPDPRSYGAM